MLEVVQACSRQALSARVLAVQAEEFISVRGFEALSSMISTTAT